MSNQAEYDALMAQLQTEFHDDVLDRLNAIYRALAILADQSTNTSAGASEAMKEIRREAHSLKGSAASFGFPIIALIAQRMETYLSNLNGIDSRTITDLHTFTDRIAAMLDRPQQPDLVETNQIIRALPVRYQFDITDIEIRDVDILLATPNKLIAKRIAVELAACGFKVNTIADSVDALSLAIRNPPDMIIAAAVMEGLPGLDLLRALRAIPQTQTIPMALLTSLDHAQLKTIPKEIAIVRLGPSFSDDIAAAVTRFNVS